MLDLLYLAHNRLEFTKASLSTLLANTNPKDVTNLIIYDDSSTDGTREFLQNYRWPAGWTVEFRMGAFGSPVAVMNDYLSEVHPTDTRLFGKIDSDTMVPANWLTECLRTMDREPGLSLLGIEAFNPVVPELSASARGFSRTPHIGGIGLMRAAHFKTLPRPAGRFGFTAWQEVSPWVNPGWLNPSLPVFLLDRLPREPWLSLTREYVYRGWARQWGAYSEDRRELWSWWCD